MNRSSELRRLKKKIEKSRGKLNKLVEDGVFDKKNTLKLSQDLDRMLIEYINLQRMDEDEEEI